MKKILILTLAVVMAGTMAACGMGDVGGAASSAAAQSAASETVVSEIGSQGMDDNLAGLEKYLAANSAVSGQPVQMEPSFIGAESGVKYQFGFEGNNNVIIELYQFNTAGLSSEAKTILDSVKSNGKYTIMNQDVSAVISDNGKYIMIYKDSSNSDKNKAHQEEVTKLFKKFKK